MTIPERFVVVGSGSIARRHMSNIRATYPEASIQCVSASGRELNISELPESVMACPSLAHTIEGGPGYAIIASPAPLHVTQAALLLSAGFTVLVEKPLSDSLINFRTHAETLRLYNDKLAVAYNLRFMPSAAVVKAVVESTSLGSILSVSSEVGQYLPDWRPDSDYRKNVSAQRALGGGALLELSHELDYIQWLFGRIESVYCHARTSGRLQLDVEDTVDALMRTQEGYIVNLHMDFLQRAPVRRCKIVAQNATLEWDILENRVVLRNRGGVDSVLHDDPEYDRNQMYVDELNAFVDMAHGRRAPWVTLEQGIETLRLVEALKQSSTTSSVIVMREFQ